VQLSTRSRYAVMAMVELAARPSAHAAGRSAPVTLADLAASQQLSQCYLEQLFGGLRRAGLVTAARGPGGGYRLARPARDIAVAEIVAAVDERVQATRCAAGEPGCLREPDGTASRCRTHDLWEELGRQIGLFLAAVTLADIVAGHVAGRAVAPAAAEPGRPAALVEVA
jgi:Rrf2 family iron-sulfur cluster assembly transcriptional regulator